jgi:hypothetical protein
MTIAPGQLVDPAGADLHVRLHFERHVEPDAELHIRLYTDTYSSRMRDELVPASSSTGSSKPSSSYLLTSRFNESVHTQLEWPALLRSAGDGGPIHQHQGMAGPAGLFRSRCRRQVSL